MLRPPSRTRSTYQLLALLLLSLAFLRSSPAWARAPRHDIQHQIEYLEEQWRMAQLAGDVATMDKMLSEDFIGITMSGQVVTKAQQLNRIRSRGFVVSRLDLEDIKVKRLGEVAIATVRARVEGTNEKKQVDGQYRYTRIYQHLPSGAWKITHFEVTHIR